MKTEKYRKENKMQNKKLRNSKRRETPKKNVNI